MTLGKRLVGLGINLFAMGWCSAFLVIGMAEGHGSSIVIDSLLVLGNWFFVLGHITWINNHAKTLPARQFPVGL